MTGTGWVTYKDIELEVDYYATPFVPEVRYLSNGDPGYPAEGGDFNIEAVRLAGSKVDIIQLMSDEALDGITEAFCNQKANEEY